MNLSAGGAFPVSLPARDSFALLSADGQAVAFSTSASLVPTDHNGTTDVYVRDLRSHGFRLVSSDRRGRAANGGSAAVGISGNARDVLFSSSAEDLTGGSPGHTPRLYVRDMQTGQTSWVGQGPHGEAPTTISASGASISRSGRFVVFPAAFGSGCGQYGVYLRDIRRGTTRLVSRAGDGAPLCTPQTPDCQRLYRSRPPLDGPAMVSNDGSIVAFWQPFAGAVHACYNDQVIVEGTHAHTLAVVDRGSSFNSPADDGGSLQWLSPDGRYIAVDALRPRVLDLRTGTTRHIAGSDAYTTPLAVNATGRFVFWGDTSNSALRGSPLYREDLATHHSSRADIVAGHPFRQGISTLFGVSDDGRYVAFATDRQDLYVVGPLAQPATDGRVRA